MIDEEFDSVATEEDNLTSIDDVADEVEDTMEDIIAGESIKDGDIIDAVMGIGAADDEGMMIGITCDENGEDLCDDCEDDDYDEDDDEDIEIDDDDEDSEELKESYNIFTVDAVLEAYLDDEEG